MTKSTKMKSKAAQPPAETRAARMIARWYELDAALQGAGYHASTPWWNAFVERLYRGSKRQAIVRVGRRGGKTTTIARLAVLEGLYGEHHVSPGDRGIVGVVSANRRPQGEDLISTIDAMLGVLGVPRRRTADEVELSDRPITFRVHSASVRGVIGGSWIFAVLDELASWRTDNEANPAEEIIAAVRPCLAPNPHGLLLLISAPQGTEDAHATLFDKGETPGQLVAWAPTWVARPTLTEAMLCEFEQDERYFARDYGAIPQAGLSDALDVAGLRECVRSMMPSHVLGAAVMLMDQSGGKVDGMPYMVARWVTDGQRRVLHFTRLAAFEGRFAESLSQDDVALTIASAARKAGCYLVVGDQHGEWSWKGSFQRAGGMPFESIAWTNDLKGEAIVRARQLIRERAIVIEPGPLAEKLLREAAKFRERVLSSSGLITFSAAGRGHDDLIMCLLLGLAHDAKARLVGSTMFAPREASTRDLGPRLGPKQPGDTWWQWGEDGEREYFVMRRGQFANSEVEPRQIDETEYTWLNGGNGLVTERGPGETLDDVRRAAHRQLREEEQAILSRRSLRTGEPRPEFIKYKGAWGGFGRD